MNILLTAKIICPCYGLELISSQLSCVFAFKSQLLYYATGANIACPTSQPALLCLTTGELSLQSCGADTVVYPAAPLGSCQVGQILGTSRAFMTTCPQPRTCFSCALFEMHVDQSLSCFRLRRVRAVLCNCSVPAPAPSGSGTTIAITVIVLILAAIVGVWVWRQFYSDAGTSEENAALRSVLQGGVDGGSLN
jgi:hypothetical protein